MELSINTVVVVVLGIIILGFGLSAFSSSIGKATEIREQIGEQTKVQLNSLLDDGSLIVIPFTSREADRGDGVDFDLAIANELGKTRYFKVYVTYAETTSDTPITASEGDSWVLDSDNANVEYSLFTDVVPNGEVDSNERVYVPIRIVVPRDATKGQYVFNVDICSVEKNPTDRPSNSPDNARCRCADGTDLRPGTPCRDRPQLGDLRYGSRQKLYITV